MKHYVHKLIGGLALLLSISGYALDSGLDTSFNQGIGPNSGIFYVKYQPNGKIIIAGDFTSINGTTINRIARLNADGSLDTSFNPGTGANNYIYSVALQSDGKIVICGTFTTVNGTTRSRIARLNADGSLDSSFNAGSISVSGSPAVNTLAVQTDGKIVIGGVFTSVGGISKNNIARLNADGSLDAGFISGTGTNNSVDTIVLQPDNKIIIGGYFTTYNGVTKNRIARLNADGSLDVEFTASRSGGVNVAIVQSDGKIVIGGEFSGRVARLNANGSADSTFNPGSGANNTVTAIAIDADGAIMLGGLFTSINGSARSYVARLNANGSVDATFDITLNHIVYSLVFQPDGYLLMGGFFTVANGSAANRIVRIGLATDYDGDGLPNMTDTDDDNDSILDGVDNCPWNSNLNQLNTDADSWGDVCDWDDDNDNVIDSIDLFPLDPTETIDTDSDGTGNTADTDDDGDGVQDSSDNCPISVGMGTDQTNTDGDSQGNLCDADDDNDGYLDGADNCPLDSNSDQLDSDIDGIGNVCDATPLPDAGFLDMNFNPGNGVTSTTDTPYIFTLAVQPDGKIIAGGVFNTVNNITKNNIVRFNSDGSLDADFNAGADNTLRAAAVQTDGKIVIGGGFTHVNGITRNRIARLNSDGSLDSSFNPGSGTDVNVETLAVLPDGKILIGGYFTVVNGIARNRIARLNSDGSLDASFNTGSGANNYIYNIAVQPDGKILIGGGFSSINGVTRNRIARLHADGSLDTGFNPNVSSAVNTIAIQPDGKILIGSSSGIARLNADGSLDIYFYVDTGSSEVRAVAVQADGKIVIGGTFNSVNGTARNNLARLNADSSGSLDSSFYPGTAANGQVWAVAVQTDGNIVIGGYFTSYNGAAINRIARVEGGGDPDGDLLLNNADADDDNDGVIDGVDNCPLNTNADQLDTDSDAVGNICDWDDDNDSVADTIDIFPLDNAESFDSDGDGIGNNAETDDDGDGVLDESDNCPQSFGLSTDQTDTDGDGLGNVCDWDDDNDDVLDAADNCVLNNNTNQMDSDLDGPGDTCDITPLPAAGFFDTSFNPGSGANDTVLTSAVQADGKVIIGGKFTSVNGVARNYIARLNADGSLDNSFNIGAGANSWVYSIAVQPDGKILIGGVFWNFNGITKSRIVRLNSDGSLDVGFNGSTDNDVRAIALQPDGKIVIAGSFSTVNGNARNKIARFNSDGSLDADFNIGSGPSSSVHALALQADGKVIIGGVFSYFNNIDARYVARLNADGSLDAGFLHSANDYVWSIAIQADGKVVVGGDFEYINGYPRSNLSRLNTDGSVDTGFNPVIVVSGSYPYMNSVVLQPDGKIIMGGQFSSVNGIARNNIARLNADGSLDSGFVGAGTNASVFTTALQRDGSIVIGGGFTTLNHLAVNRIVRIGVDSDGDHIGNSVDSDDDNDAVLDVADNCQLNSNLDQLNSDVDTQGNTCDADDDNDGVIDIYDQYPLDETQAGDYDNDGVENLGDNCPLEANVDQLNTDADAQGDTCDVDDDSDSLWDVNDNCPLLSNISQLDADTDGVGDLCDATPLPAAGYLDSSFNAGSGANNTIYGVAVQNDGKTLIGGAFITFNGTTINRIARLNADGTLDTSFNPGTGVSTDVRTLAVQVDGKIIIGGAFTTFNGTAINRIARLNADGSLDVTFNPGTGANGDVRAVAVQLDGKIIIGGAFTAVNGTTRNRIARLNVDGSLDLSFVNPLTYNSFNPGITTISAIGLQADGKMYIGGDFLSVYGDRIARLNNDGTQDFNFYPGSTSGIVYAVSILPDGRVCAGGTFTVFYGAARNRIVCLNSNGSVDSSFNPPNGANSTVYTVVTQPDGKVVIGGDFSSVNGTTRNRIARLNVDGSLDLSFSPGSGVSGTVRSMAVPGNGNMMVAGNFSSYNTIAVGSIVRIHTGDSDEDGIEDAADQFPNDTDNDNITNDVDSDDDNDLMPDAWENTYGLNPLLDDASGDTDGDGFTNLQEYTNSTNPAVPDNVVASVKNDYTNGGIAGWIWKGQSNGYETVSQIWQLTFPLASANYGVPNRFYPPPFPDQANWEIVTSGDFNKDGDADILWRHNTLATWKVWQMQNGTRVAQNAPADFDLAHEWQVIGAGDTDKDGDDDVILNNTATGEVLIWQMQDHAIAATHNVGTKAGYTVNRIGDFNKDGDVDLLFRQVGGDVLVTWELEGNTFVAERALANTGTNYNPVCAGDFDGDGDDDIMLVNNATTQEKWFVMENYARTQAFGASNSGFVFKGCGDYDGDGDADSLWQRSADDANRVVLQQNFGVSKQTVYTNAFGGVNPGAAGYGFVYRGNSN